MRLTMADGLTQDYDAGRACMDIRRRFDAAISIGSKGSVTSQRHSGVRLSCSCLLTCWADGAPIRCKAT